MKNILFAAVALLSLAAATQSFASMNGQGQFARNEQRGNQENWSVAESEQRGDQEHWKVAESEQRGDEENWKVAESEQRGNQENWG